MNLSPMKGPTLNCVPFELFQSTFLVQKQETPPPSENCLQNLNLELPNIKSRQLVTSEISFKPEEGKSQFEMNTISQKTKTAITFDLLSFHLKREKSLVIPLIKKFIMTLRNAASLKSINQLKNYSLLGDLTFFPEKTLESQNESQQENTFLIWLEQKAEKLKKIEVIKKISKFLETHNTIIYPYQTLRILWDSVHLILIVYWFFAIPLFSVFRDIPSRDDADCYITIVFLILDIFLNFNTAYFKKGLIEQSRLKIFSNYWKNYLKYDIITLMPLLIEHLLRRGYFPDLSFIHLFKFFFFLKISTCQEICSRILERFLLKEKLRSIMDLIKTFFISILVAHLFACFWFLIGDFSMEKYQFSWILKADLLDASWDIKYLYSIYWASVTMMTVGYGDITPQNELEVVVCIVSVILGCAVYAYNISSIGMILQELNKENAEFNHKINVINRFMIRKNINKDLQRRIREYLRFLWKEENTQNFEEEQKIIEFLSGSLREELYIDAYGSLLKQDPMFFTNFSEKTLTKLVSKIKEIRLFPEEKILFENEEDDSSIYFVVKGKMELVSKGGNLDIGFQEIEIGGHFGEFSFFTGKRREISARSKDFTTLFAIRRADFLEILEKNHEDYEKCCMVRDQILLYGNYNPIYMRCFCCKQTGHLASVCPTIHFIPDKEKIIKTKMFYNDQNRNHLFVRKKKNRISAFISKISLAKASLRIQETLIKEKTEEQLRAQSINSEDEEEGEIYPKAEEAGKSSYQIDFSPATIKESLVKENSLVKIQDFREDSKCQETLHQMEKYRSSPSLTEIKSEKINYETEKMKLNSKVSTGPDIQKQYHNTNSSTLERNTAKKKTGIEYNKKLASLAHLNSPSDADAIAETPSYVFEIVKSFKNYFPEQNIQNILKDFNKKNQIHSAKNKDHQKKMKENKRRLAKYTFYTEEMRKHMLDQVRRRASIAKKKRNGLNGDSPAVRLLPLINKTSIKVMGAKSFADVTKKLLQKQTLKRKIKKRNK